VDEDHSHSRSIAAALAGAGAVLAVRGPRSRPSETLARAVSLAGRRILWCWHRAQPRHYLWSLRVTLDDRG